VWIYQSRLRSHDMRELNQIRCRSMCKHEALLQHVKLFTCYSEAIQDVTVTLQMHAHYSPSVNIVNIINTVIFYTFLTICC